MHPTRKWPKEQPFEGRRCAYRLCDGPGARTFDGAAQRIVVLHTPVLEVDGDQGPVGTRKHVGTQRLVGAPFADVEQRLKEGPGKELTNQSTRVLSMAPFPFFTCPDDLLLRFSSINFALRAQRAL